MLSDPQVEWYDRVVVPFTSVEGPNEGGSAFGVERAIRAVTIAFWASLLLNFRRALRPSKGSEMFCSLVLAIEFVFTRVFDIPQVVNQGSIQKNSSSCAWSSTELIVQLASVRLMHCEGPMSTVGCHSLGALPLAGSSKDFCKSVHGCRFVYNDLLRIFVRSLYISCLFHSQSTDVPALGH